MHLFGSAPNLAAENGNIQNADCVCASEWVSEWMRRRTQNRSHG